MRNVDCHVRNVIPHGEGEGEGEEGDDGERVRSQLMNFPRRARAPARRIRDRRDESETWKGDRGCEESKKGEGEGRERGRRRSARGRDVETSIQISMELDPGILAFIPLVSSESVTTIFAILRRCINHAVNTSPVRLFRFAATFRDRASVSRSRNLLSYVTRESNVCYTYTDVYVCPIDGVFCRALANVMRFGAVTRNRSRVCVCVCVVKLMFY